MKKLLLACQDQEFCSLLYDQLYTGYQIHVCRSGADVVDDFLSFLPDLLVLELEMPCCDTVGLFQAVRAQAGQTIGIVITHADPLHIKVPLSRFPQLFLMTEPIDVHQVVRNVELMAQQHSLNEPRCLPVAIDEILQQLSFRYGSSGFSCLREGIIYRHYNPDCLYTDELYPYVAKRCDGSAQSVVKAMTRSIQAAWKSRNPVLWSSFFPDNAPPTCAAFISTIAQWLQK